MPTKAIENGYSFDSLISQPSFYRALVSKGTESLKLEWVRDTAFRFFPVIGDEELGYRLHDVDLAINKCLALANRTEIRDILDIIELDINVIPLAHAIWGACGKDPGFTPDLILEMIQRHAVISPDLLLAESLTKPIDPKELKLRFLNLMSNTKDNLSQFPVKELGCVFLDKKGNVVRNYSSNKENSYIRHFGSVKGSWPRLVNS